MIVVYTDFCCAETGYYLAERYDVPLVLLSIVQVDNVSTQMLYTPIQDIILYLRHHGPMLTGQ